MPTSGVKILGKSSLLGVVQRRRQPAGRERRGRHEFWFKVRLPDTVAAAPRANWRSLRDEVRPPAPMRQTHESARPWSASRQSSPLRGPACPSLPRPRKRPFKTGQTHQDIRVRTEEEGVALHGGAHQSRVDSGVGSQLPPTCADVGVAWRCGDGGRPAWSGQTLLSDKTLNDAVLMKPSENWKT